MLRARTARCRDGGIGLECNRHPKRLYTLTGDRTPHPAPRPWVTLLASSADLAIVSYLADEDLLMTSLPLGIIGALFVTTTIGYALGLDRAPQQLPA